MEIINSFFSNIKDKLTNPFFGTLILVLIINHWELWFTIFNFDSDCTLVDKITIIRNYTLKNLTILKFIWDVTQAVIFMILGYLIIVLTRSLVIWVEFSLMPFITGKIVSKNVVQKNVYDDVVIEREKYFDQYEEQRKNVRLFSKTIDEQIQQIKVKDSNLLEQSNIISETVKELDLIKSNLENTENKSKVQLQEINELKNSNETLQKENDLKNRELNEYENLFFSTESNEFFSSLDRFTPEILKKVRELKEEKKWKTFIALGNFFENGGSIGGQALTDMINKGIAFERGNKEKFTPIGKIIWNYRFLFDNNYEIY